MVMMAKLLHSASCVLLLWKREDASHGSTTSTKNEERKWSEKMESRQELSAS